MDRDDLARLLAEVAAGETHPTAALERLRHLWVGDLSFASIDHHRLVRQGFAETIYGPGKTPEQVAMIALELLGASEAAVIGTRMDAPQVETVTKVALDKGYGPPITTWSAKLATIAWRPRQDRGHSIIVVTAGTADLPVATECVAVLDALGLSPRLLADRGVAGLQRIIADLPDLAMADAVVVVAGMEGALASVVGGITPAPVVAVPTSVGYGSSLEGVTALLSMLASCANGVSVVGIDNGYGAAMAVARMIGLRP